MPPLDPSNGFFQRDQFLGIFVFGPFFLGNSTKEGNFETGEGSVLSMTIVVIRIETVWGSTLG